VGGGGGNLTTTEYVIHTINS